MDLTSWKKRDKKVKKWLKSRGMTPPYGEWRLPIMILCLSSFIFILITTGANMRVNSLTGELIMDMDWSDTEEYRDPWVYDPFDIWVAQNRTAIYAWFMVLFYASLTIFFHQWFKYMRWKCRHGYDEKEIKKPDNKLYMIKKQDVINNGRKK